MSMLGMSFLNNIVNEKGNTEPGPILNQLRKYIVSSLHQVDSEFHSKDGMDICLCAINKSNNMLYYAGAFNPLLLVRNGDIIENEVDRMPVAISEIMDNFKTREMPLLPGDCIYLFSDGYCDQFGGPRNKKFLKTNFKAKLLEIYQDKMDNQLAILDKTIEDYKGENFQTDDILVVGMRY